MQAADNERVKRVYEYLKTNKIVHSQVDFAQNIGSFPSDISKILRQKQDVSNKLLVRISNAFPQISLKWLQTGEGEMVVETKNRSGDDDIVSNETVVSFVELLKLKEQSLQKSQAQIDSLLELVNRLAK